MVTRGSERVKNLLREEVEGGRKGELGNKIICCIARLLLNKRLAFLRNKETALGYFDGFFDFCFSFSVVHYGL